MKEIVRELFVISDLHLGGLRGANPEDRGFCINPHGDKLAAFVKQLGQRAQANRHAVELVINGDLFDFLALESATPVGVAVAPLWVPFIEDSELALGALRQVLAQERAFFDELRDFLSFGGDLTLVLGNHDLELSLPRLRETLAARLETPGGRRIRFVIDGEAYRAGPHVLIEHGNRYDGFNVVEHDELRRLRSAQSRGEAGNDRPRFHPPPGSHLVAEVMNPIKARYSFVDLLKPETGAVIPLLLALEPGLFRDVEALWTAYRLRREANAQNATEAGWPAGIGQIGTAGLQTPPPPSLQDLLAARMGPAELQRLLDCTSPALAALQAAEQRIGMADDARWLWSITKLARGGHDWARRRLVLLDALRTLQHDRTFDPGFEEPAYLRHAEHFVGRDVARPQDTQVNVVVFGHTHLAKQIELPRAGEPATYINTGTWAELMRLPSDLFHSSQNRALAALDDFVQALDRNAFGDYVFHAPHFAHVVLASDGRVLDARLQAAAGFDAESLQ